MEAMRDGMPGYYLDCYFHARDSMKNVIATDCIARSTCGLGEGPRWDERRELLWWCDVKVPSLLCMEPGSQTWKTHRTPGKTLGSWSLTESDQLLLALEDGLYAWTLGEVAARPLAHIESVHANQRLNDGRCDAKGRFWVGSMNQNERQVPLGVFYRMDQRGKLSSVFDGFKVPNSVAFSRDSKKMYFADTPEKKIFVYDFDLEEGRLFNRRLFKDCASNPGMPDGSTVDVDGCLWNAEYKGGRVVRYTPDGREDTVIHLPVSQPTACVFGGKNLDVLYITSARQNLNELQCEEQPLAGGLFVSMTGAQGTPEPRFGGDLMPDIS